jgi:hypothetical protein
MRACQGFSAVGGTAGVFDRSSDAKRMGWRSTARTIAEIMEEFKNSPEAARCLKQQCKAEKPAQDG